MWVSRREASRCFPALAPCLKVGMMDKGIRRRVGTLRSVISFSGYGYVNEDKDEGRLFCVCVCGTMQRKVGINNDVARRSEGTLQKKEMMTVERNRKNGGGVWNGE